LNLLDLTASLETPDAAEPVSNNGLELLDLLDALETQDEAEHQQNLQGAAKTARQVVDQINVLGSFLSNHVEEEDVVEDEDFAAVVEDALLSSDDEMVCGSECDDGLTYCPVCSCKEKHDTGELCEHNESGYCPECPA
jgi:hypothetical protein